MTAAMLLAAATWITHPGSVIAAPQQSTGCLSRTHLPNAKPGGPFEVSPPRLEAPAPLGKHLTFTITAFNPTGQPLSVVVRPQAFRSSQDPTTIGAVSQTAPFGARDWIHVCTRKFRLAHGDKVSFPLQVDVPGKLSPGSYYAALQLIASFPSSSGASRPGAGVQNRIGVNVELLFNVPGPVTFDERFVDSQVTHSVLSSGDNRFVGIHASLKNYGTETDALSAQVAFHSWLGNSVTTLAMDGGSGLVLRGGTRAFQALWSDPPWFGHFTPTVTVHGRGGHSYTKKLPGVWVLPPWWFLVLLALAIIAPIAIITWRTRRRSRIADDFDPDAETDDDDLVYRDDDLL